MAWQQNEEQQERHVDEDPLARAEQLAGEPHPQRIEGAVGDAGKEAVAEAGKGAVAEAGGVAAAEGAEDGNVVDREEGERRRGAGREPEGQPPGAGPERRVDGEAGGQDEVRRPGGDQQPAGGARRRERAAGRLGGGSEQRHDREQLGGAVLPQRLARDGPGLGAEGEGQGEQQGQAALQLPAQQQVHERAAGGRDRGGGGLLGELGGDLHVADVAPAMMREIERGGHVERRHQQRHDDRIARGEPAAGRGDQPVRLGP